MIYLNIRINNKYHSNMQENARPVRGRIVCPERNRRNKELRGLDREGSNPLWAIFFTC